MVRRNLFPPAMAFLDFFLIAVFTGAALGNRGYLVAHPRVLRPGTEHISVTIFDPTEPVLVQVRLSWRNHTFASAERSILGKGVLTLEVPENIRGRVTLDVCGNCLTTSRGYHFRNSTDIAVGVKSSSVFIQIDRPVYKPGQSVLINFIVVGPDLRPKDENIFAYIEDPKGSRMVQWRELNKQCCGLRNATFPLSDQPILGDWTIYAEVNGQTYNKTFTIEKYIAPKFEVLIHPPRFIIDINRCKQATVEARYIYGKPVKGKVSINMKLVGIGYYDNYIGHNQFLFRDIDGVSHFNICVSQMVSSSLNPYFKGAIEIEASVTSSDGHVFVAQDDSCLVKRQPIGLEYTVDTIKHFKPGLPYEGKLSVYFPDDSEANQVTVKVNAESNNYFFYQEDLLSENGVVSFKVDKIPDDASLVWFSATVMKWKGRYPGGTYYPIYHSASSWYSPSNCFIQTKLLNDGKIKVGDHVVVGVLSTCSCNVSLHYHLMSRGDLVYSGVKEPHAEDISYLSVNDSILCKTAITFDATHAMAPSTQLMVYYLRSDNETVADNLPLHIEPSFENEVSIQFSSNSTSPGSKLSMTVTAKQGSCICVGSVDRSVQLLQPGYELNSQKVFSEIDTFNILEPSRPETWWTRIRRHARSTSWRGTQPTDSYQAFKASGLNVMTDRANLRFQPKSADSEEWSFQTLETQQGGERNTRNMRRAYFPETWLWDCFNMSSTRKQEQFRVHVPDSITTWSTQAFAMSEVHGFGLSEQSSLVSIKKFFVDFTLPYSVIRDEQVRLPVSVYNYHDICVQVTLTISLQEGSQFADITERTKTETLCMQEQETQTVYVEVGFNQLGKVRIHASAEAFSAYGCCTDDVVGDVLISSDRISRSILVEPEGIPRAYTYSVFFCPNERIHLTTPNRYEYQFLRKPPTMDFLTFMCKASNDARIALATSRDSHVLYEIVIGGWGNTQTWLSRERSGTRLRATVTREILNRNEFRAFWIIWRGGHIQVGMGEVPSNQSMVLRWQDDNPLSVNYIGFSTGFGSTGEFRIWKKKSNSEMFIEAFTLTLPLNFIPGSEKAKAVMIADVMGPTLNNLQNLIRLPFGCGEQNMIHFAPNIYVMSYLERTGQLTPEIKTEATGFLVQGYQRQLTYKRHDGSYSAFGESDSSGSMWLTAFVLKSFAQSKAYIYIDPLELSMTKSWIISQQLIDGAFPPVGRVLNKDIQGGIQGMASLTAYVVVALLESGLMSDREKLSVERGQRFLESNINAIHDSYTAALTAYALTLRESPAAPEVVRLLTSKSLYSDGLRYWSLSGQPHEVLPHYNVLGNFQQTVTSAEVEMTAYALLTYTARRNIAYSLPIVKWLTKQRNSLGGFSSTQDTCVALQALAEYAALSFVRDVNLTISLGYVDEGQSVEQVYHITNDNSKVLQTVEVPALSRNLFLRSTGEGCGLLQVDVNYNIPDPNRNPAFRLNVDLLEPLSDQFSRGKRDANVIPGTRRQKARVVIRTCARWLHAGSSNMAVVEVELVSGFTADLESLEQLLFNRHAKVKRYEVEGRKVILYFDEIPSQCMTCVSFIAQQDFLVRKLHAVPVKVYDYYEPHYEAISMYNVTGDIRRDQPCEEEHCNQVGDASHREEVFSPNLVPPRLDLCNMVNGDCVFMADMIECSCERTCGYGGPPVCGSDGLRYDNYCHMEVAACQKDEIIKILPLDNCNVPQSSEPFSQDDTPTDGIPPNKEDSFPDEDNEEDYPSDDSASESQFSISIFDQDPLDRIVQWLPTERMPTDLFEPQNYRPAPEEIPNVDSQFIQGSVEHKTTQDDAGAGLTQDHVGAGLTQGDAGAGFTPDPLLWFRSTSEPSTLFSQSNGDGASRDTTDEVRLDRHDGKVTQYEISTVTPLEKENAAGGESQGWKSTPKDGASQFGGERTSESVTLWDEEQWRVPSSASLEVGRSSASPNLENVDERYLEDGQDARSDVINSTEEVVNTTGNHMKMDPDSMEMKQSQPTLNKADNTVMSGEGNTGSSADLGDNLGTENVMEGLIKSKGITTPSSVVQESSTQTTTQRVSTKRTTTVSDQRIDGDNTAEKEDEDSRELPQIPRWIRDHSVRLPDVIREGPPLPWNARTANNEQKRR